MSHSIYLLSEEPEFPPASLAQDEPNGLLAVGGDLSIPRLIEAYRNGIFPWFCRDEPILWWSPNPRCVFKPEQLHISRSLKRQLKNHPYQITINQDFKQVIESCAAPRTYEIETWILPEMQSAYQQLHQQGLAHSIELWHEDKLVGGLYGISMGKFFFGESMFSRVTNASKIVLVYLCHYLQSHDFELLDAQVGNPHLYSMGAQDLAREDFINLLEKYRDWAQPENLWQTKTLENWR